MQENINEKLDKNADYYFHLDGLTVGYNGKPLISDIEIGIHKGEIVTLIGPNGAGKSTILKSISRQLEIVGGKVAFDGKEIREYSYKDLSCKMAVVLTERMKPELMTCHDIVATGRYPYTGRLGVLTPEDEQKVEDAMKAVHAADLGFRDFNAISDGQRQRVLLARAICQEPDIILLDEPTSFLDIRHKLELLSILRNMAKAQNITVIMSLHEIDLAMKISDRILCIKGDHIFKEGTPEEVFEEELIRELYSIDNGFFDPLFGSIELPAPTGKIMVHETEAEEKAGNEMADENQTEYITASNSCSEDENEYTNKNEEISANNADIFVKINEFEQKKDNTAETEKDIEETENAEPDESTVKKENKTSAEEIDINITKEKTIEPKVMVVSSGGTGIPVYRKLQKENIPFIAGILYTNDIDYQLARLLAAEVITEKPFCRISEETKEKALKAVDRCENVINAGVEIGEYNLEIKEILEYAERRGKLEVI